ncbi:MATE family efflux transporter [Streptomyces sp. CMB-StM0423]|uniref:MATE family efflux transporter n=1 Tax=Streptomyces sp. CMB-StM0423 TaxID=2059884 RepID=UPI000C70238B|nr:MATE family efflux transporter [Streptomyces sp. CMB-StM0423]AUH39371.1 MATE family efflux transporter [Streptomyces sp. CMB-StM0423]
MTDVKEHGDPAPGAAPAPPGDLRARLRGLAVPICLGVVTGLGAQFAISALLGNMGGDALYIRALFIPVSFFFLALEEGIEISSQVVSARRRGAGAGEDSQPPLVRIGAIALGCFAVAAAVIALAAPQMAGTLDVDAAAHDDFVLFARLVAASFLLAVLTSVVAGTLRGWGSARSASVITIAVAGMQVLGVWLLGFYADMGVFAVPASIAGASVVGLTSGLVLLARAGLLRFGGPAEPLRQTVGILVAVGVPVAVSYLFIAGMNYTSLWVLSDFGSDAVAGYGGAHAVQVLSLSPAIALGSAVAITMNQSLGAGESHLLRPVLREGVRYVLMVYAVLAVAGFALAGPLGRLMSDDAGTAAFTDDYLTVVAPSWLAFGLLNMVTMSLQQVRNGHITIASDIVYLGAVNVGGGLLARAVDHAEAYFAALAVGNVVIGALLLATAWQRFGRAAEAA